MAAVAQQAATTALADLSDLASARQSIAETHGLVAALSAQLADGFELFVSAVQIGHAVESSALREQRDLAATWQRGL